MNATETHCKPECDYGRNCAHPNNCKKWMKAEEHPLSQEIEAQIKAVQKAYDFTPYTALSCAIKTLSRVPELLKAEQERDEATATVHNISKVSLKRISELQETISALDAAVSMLTDERNAAWEENQKIKLDSMEESRRLIDENFDLKSAVLKGLAEEGSLKTEITRLKAEVWGAGKNVGINYYLHEGRGQDNELL